MYARFVRILFSHLPSSFALSDALVLLQVFLGRLDKLADHMVNPSSGGPWKVDAEGKSDKAACVAELKRRLKPVPLSIKRPNPNHRGMKGEDRNYHRG